MESVELERRLGEQLASALSKEAPEPQGKRNAARRTATLISSKAMKP
jgi:hypothetical protein